MYKKETGYNFFDKQDMLLNYNKLELIRDRFDFIIENQGAWMLQTEKSELAKVYLDTGEELGLLKNFLITYVLQELTFSLEYICYSTELSYIKSIFENVELIYSGKYVYLVSARKLAVFGCDGQNISIARLANILNQEFTFCK